MPKITGVRFRTAGKNYYYDPEDMDLKVGDHVIVETIRGVEMGQITIPVLEVSEEKIKEPLKSILRKASESDIEEDRDNRRREREAFKICQQKIKDHGLEMKLIEAEYTFDRDKLLFYFTADGRVDFRELVKDLAGVFRTRIELRQIGVRDETKVLGGLGICGRELCCKTFLQDFAPVSIKMAKEQNLSLNPTKISGVCGRLMCCLKNEEETYEYLNKKMPQKGDGATTAEGEEGVVTSINILRQKVAVLFETDDTKEIREYGADELTYIPKKQRRERERAKAEELQKRREEAAARGETIPEDDKKNGVFHNRKLIHTEPKNDHKIEKEEKNNTSEKARQNRDRQGGKDRGNNRENRENNNNRFNNRRNNDRKGRNNNENRENNNRRNRDNQGGSNHKNRNNRRNNNDRGDRKGNNRDARFDRGGYSGFAHNHEEKQRPRPKDDSES